MSEPVPVIITGAESTAAVQRVAVALFNRAILIGTVVKIRRPGTLSTAGPVLIRAAWLNDAGEPVCGVEGIAACIAVAFNALDFDATKGTYNARMAKTHERHLTELVEKTIDNLKRKKSVLTLAAFHAQCGWQRAQDIPPGDDDLVMAFPPTYSGDYAKMFKKVSEAFSWNVPTFKELTSSADFSRQVLARPGPWVLLAEEPSKEMAEVVGKPFGKIHRSGSKDVYLFSNIDFPLRFTRRSVGVGAAPKCRRITDTDVITADSKLAIQPMNTGEAAYIRQVYSSVKPIQGAADSAFGVFVDGKLIGIFMFRLGSVNLVLGGESYDSRQVCFILSDLSIASERHERLSKLITMAGTTKEFQTMLQRQAVQDIQVVYTVVFSNNPVSMKYRPYYTLHTRKQSKTGEFTLTYFCKLGSRTLQEAFTEWHKKHYRTRFPAPSKPNSTGSTGP